jgi:hypothetical protein
MGHIHQHGHRRLGKRQPDEVAGADAIAARQLGAPVPSSATSKKKNDSGATVLSIVYVTDSPTSTEVTGGYPTIDVGDPVQQTPSSSKHHKSTSSSADDTFATFSDVTSSSTSQSPTSTSTSSSSTFAIMTSTSAIVASTTSLVTSTSSKSSPTVAGGAIAEATASSTGQASASTVQKGMSAGGKTGLAIGILLAVAIIAVGVLLLYWKKKKAIDEDEKSHNEKAAFGADAAPMAHSLPSPPPPTTIAAAPPAPRVMSSAPMLDLRPMSRLMPELAGQRKSQGNPLNTFNMPAGAAAAGVSRSLTPAQNGSPSERPTNTANEKVENPFSDPTNPFGDEQAKAVSPPPSGPTVPSSSPSMPAPLNIQKAGPPVTAGAGTGGVGTDAVADATTTAAAAAAAGAGAAVAAVAAAKPPGSPASVRSAALSQASVGSGPGAPPNNVHRVLIDFKPSMEDELELVSGQVVRILHEYDDGWVSCDFCQTTCLLLTILTGSVYSPRPLSTGCRSTNLPFTPTAQTPSDEQWAASSRPQKSSWTSSRSKRPSDDSKWPSDDANRRPSSTNDANWGSSSTNDANGGSSSTNVSS